MTGYASIRIAIGDDHEAFRIGLKTMIGKSSGIEIVADAANGRDLLSLVLETKPDVVLVDIIMPVMDGVQFTRQLAIQSPGTNAIALSMFNDDHLIIDILNAGAKGYLIKNATKQEILEAITAAYYNQTYYCRSTSMKLARLIANNLFDPHHKIEKETFSQKEIEIIQFICLEFTNKQIGDKLCLSSRTVEGYRQKIADKTNSKTTAGIVIYAIRNGIYKI
ncbi:MAG: response regulator transcription factor [Chitinophagaceae bacterium]|nr:response regulator transcription factor [Chitinophagaceae bacterium]